MVKTAAWATISPAMEDYLLAIYRLEGENRRPGTGEIAQALGVSAASATSMFKKLAHENLVSYREYGGVHLTPAGRESALGLVRRHRLAERFLTDLLKLPWDDVHRIADRLEHALPPEVIERFDGLLQHPATCPHGHPIPRPDGRMPEREEMPLTDLAAGQRALVARVEERDPQMLRHLGELGIRPGVRVEVDAVEPFEGGMRVRVEGRRALISLRVAEAVSVGAVETGAGTGGSAT